MKKFRVTELLIYIVFTELVGALSALLAGGKFREFFDTLTKPPFSPPAWVFPVAWALLYALMGYSVYLISISGNSNRSKALKKYALQLTINFLWTPIFFGMKSLLGGLVTIVLLDIFIVLMMIEFKKIRRKAAYLNIPYLAWCLYATYLTAGVFILNK